MNFERCSSIRSWRDVESSKAEFDVWKKLLWITRLRTQSSTSYSDFLFLLRMQLLICDLDKPACLHFITNSKLIKPLLANSKGLTQKFRKDQTTENHKCLTASENTAWADWSKVILHTFVDINDITTGGIAHLSPATTRCDNKFYIIKLVIKLYIWSQFCELAMPTDVSKTSRVL